MKTNLLKKVYSIVLLVVFSFSFLVACSQTTSSTNTAQLEGGTLLLKVNPEIAISYDKDGKVTNIESRNDDAKKILELYKEFKGKDTKQVITDLVAEIGKAGYFVEEVDGNPRKITIEIEKGSNIANKEFLDDIMVDVKKYVNENQYKASLDIVGESDYGIDEYVDTDYGTDNDGVTDYNDTDYGPNNDGVTDYDENDTDYGANNDGVTNYDDNDTDYGANNDGVTDYNDTDYGPNNDGVTDYNDTDYGPNNDGVTDYNDTDYGANNDGVTDYSVKNNTTSTPQQTDNGNSNYDSNDDNDSDDNDND